MAYQHSSIEAALSAAVGDDPSLMRDLRQAFLQSAETHVQTLSAAASVSEWHMAAWRFKGLCASFGVESLARLATEATEAPLGDPSLMRRIQVALRHMTTQD